MFECQLQEQCDRFSLINNVLWCVCYSGKFVKYTTQGQLLSIIVSDVIKDPVSVYPHIDQHVLVAAMDGLYRMTTDGEDVIQVMGGEFCDVHANKDYIAALEVIHAESCTDILHVFENTCCNNLFGHTHVMESNDFNIRVLVANNNDIYLSSEAETGKQPGIRKYQLLRGDLSKVAVDKYIDEYNQRGRSGPIIFHHDEKMDLVFAVHEDKLHLYDKNGVCTSLELQGLASDAILTGTHTCMFYMRTTASASILLKFIISRHD